MIHATTCDCHMHMVLDGLDWKQAIGRHAKGVDYAFIRATLQRYQALGYTYLRDGGDRWGVGKAARDMADEFGIRYVTPLSPLCHAGHYGAFIGEKYEDLHHFAALVKKQQENGADFIKIMISGLMDFNQFGVLSEEGLPPAEIREVIHIAQDHGLSVMVHANGARTVEAAAAAGVQSVEHGAYLDEDALAAMAESGTVWVPTLSAIGNLLGTGRFPDPAVSQILHSALENLARFAQMGGLVACGSDAGAWSVTHGCETEVAWLRQALGSDTQRILSLGNAKIQSLF